MNNIFQNLKTFPSIVALLFIATSAYAINDGPIPFSSKQSIDSQKSLAVPMTLAANNYSVRVLPERNDTATSYPPKGVLTCVMNNIESKKIVGADLANTYNLCSFNIKVDKEDTFLLMVRNGTDSTYTYSIMVLEK